MITVCESSQMPTDEEELWDRTITGAGSFERNLGIISRFFFVDLVNRVLVPNDANRVIWRAQDSKGVVFLPCYLETKGNLVMKWVELRYACDLYPGRSAAAIGFDSESVHGAFLERVFSAQERWDAFYLTLVSGGSAEKQTIRVAKEYHATTGVDSELEYPYIELPNQWNVLYQGFTKKFRYNIRNSTKLLKQQGPLELVESAGEQDVPRFLKDVLQVERDSWKEAAGTSLTTNRKQQLFHAQLAHGAASRGVLRGYVLYVGGEAVAHIFGVLTDGVFYSLKLSFSEKYRKYSPGIVITSLVLQALINEGVRYWDFAGPTEDYKKRWTDKSYRLKTLVFFSKRLKGRVLAMKKRMKGLV